MKNLKTSIIRAIIILFVGILIGSAIVHAFQPKADKVVISKTVTNDKVNASRITSDITNVIQDGFRDIGMLTTYEYFYREVDTKETQKDLWNIKLPWTKGGYTISYEGVVDAGIDFSDIVVEIKDNIIFIKMPEAKIISNTLDESSLEIYDESHNPFNQNQIEDFNKSISTIKEAALERAIKNDILKNAKKNATVLVENFVKSVLDDVEYKIVFK